MRLARAGLMRALLVGSAEAARLLTEHGQRHGHLHRVLIEIDTDDHRCGFPPQADALLQGGGRNCSTVAAPARNCGA